MYNFACVLPTINHHELNKPEVIVTAGSTTFLPYVQYVYIGTE